MKDKDWRNALRPHEVNVPDKFALQSKRHRYYWKRCYEKAFDYVMDISKEDQEGVMLIHGEVLAVGIRIHFHFDHAWVELPGDIVFDGVMQKFYDKNGYYHVLQATKRTEYKPREVANNLLKYNHYGPWDNE